MTRQVLAGAHGVMACVLVDTDSGKPPPASPVRSLTEIGISLEKLGLCMMHDDPVTATQRERRGFRSWTEASI